MNVKNWRAAKRPSTAFIVSSWWELIDFLELCVGHCVLWLVSEWRYFYIKWVWKWKLTSWIANKTVKNWNRFKKWLILSNALGNSQKFTSLDFKIGFCPFSEHAMQFAWSIANLNVTSSNCSTDLGDTVYCLWGCGYVHSFQDWKIKVKDKEKLLFLCLLLVMVVVVVCDVVWSLIMRALKEIHCQGSRHENSVNKWEWVKGKCIGEHCKFCCYFCVV